MDPKPDSTQTDLMTSVATLVDCLEDAAAPLVPGKNNGQAIDTALDAASSAERRIAEQMERIAFLERLAITDDLTGLLNRRGFENQIRHSLAVARRYGERGVLVYVDLDGFKSINDTYGHAAGDEVLCQVAKALMRNVRDTDYVGRMGGDEFAILLTRTTEEDGLNRAEGLDRVLNRIFTRWGGQLIALRASVGFLAYGPDDDGYELLKNADEAMYKTKRRRAGLSDQRASA
jgi:diguanylate cyclase (GGDEF)-like protein